MAILRPASMIETDEPACPRIEVRGQTDLKTFRSPYPATRRSPADDARQTPRTLRAASAVFSRSWKDRSLTVHLRRRWLPLDASAPWYAASAPSGRLVRASAAVLRLCAQFGRRNHRIGQPDREPPLPHRRAHRVRTSHRRARATDPRRFNFRWLDAASGTSAGLTNGVIRRGSSPPT